MDIKNLKKSWNFFGKTDPFWAILSHTEKKGNKWEVKEFFDTGTKEIDALMDYVQSLNIDISKGRALDFGCAVGRLTQALAHYFDEVYGIDISPSMLELAKEYNQYSDKCKYYLNSVNDLKIFPDNNFDFIYSMITLQHMKPEYSKAYVKEFLRVLSPNGILIFQLPSELLNISDMNTSKPVNSDVNSQSVDRKGKFKRVIKDLMPARLLDLQSAIRHRFRSYREANQPRIEMYAIQRDEVISFLEENGARIIDLQQNSMAGPEFSSFSYCVTI